MKTTPTLLIIDDEEDVLEVLESDLRALGARLLTSSCAQQALDLIHFERPDAILSDIKMPKMSGLALLARLRELQIETPFVFLTGNGDKGMVTEALRLGALDFQEKPYDRDVLREVMRKALAIGVELRRLGQELESFMEMLSRRGESSEALERLRALKRTLIIQRKYARAYFKKAA